MQADTKAAPGRKLISSGSEFETIYNYSRAVVVGNQVMVSGTTGYDYATGELPVGAAAQAEKLFGNLEAALAKAGGSLADTVRVRIYISHPDAYEDVMQAYARAFAGVSPACTTVEAKLFDPAIFVEIDLDAILNARA